VFAWWGYAVSAYRRGVFAAVLLVVVAGVAWGLGVFGSVSGSGFGDERSPSARAHQRINAELGDQDIDIVALYRSPTVTVDDPAMHDPIAAVLARLRADPSVALARSYYDGPPGPSRLASNDRHATYVEIRLADESDDAKLAAYHEIRAGLEADGLITKIGGTVPFVADANDQTSTDVARAEKVSLPILLVLLLLIFGGLIAASLPLLVGGLAILGAFVVTRLLTYVTEVSVFAINVITLIGMGMAIDYSLFILSRFREELAGGHDAREAVARTVRTAGRTVAISGITVALALSSLLIFPQGFLRSMGFGGIAAVMVAMLASLTALPAALSLLGPRVNALRVPLPRWGSGNGGGTAGAWARLARAVMRRPILFAGAVIIVLAVLSAPFYRISFGGVDERVLPDSSPSRQVATEIANGFPGGGVAPIAVLVSGAPATQAYLAALSALPGATGATVAAQRGTSTLVMVNYSALPASAAARTLVGEIEAVPAPPGAEVSVSGRPAFDRDMLHGIGAKLPWMILIVLAVTVVLLFLAFGSVVLPVKAILMNAVSIGASFGVVVWIFQDGHLSHLLAFTPTGYLAPTNPILMLAVLFGLSTDYEVFLLSRVREEWDLTGDNQDAVAIGLQRTGGIITAAALLLIIVIGGFATGGTIFIKIIGVGMIVAILVDATLVRALLVPATMRLLGRWNWWAPGPLIRFWRRYGFAEELPERELVGTASGARPG
jgi:RND superfamily putative drug exporter